MTFPAWIGQVADVLSLLGFIITIKVALDTNNLRKSFTIRARTPELRTQLEKCIKLLRPQVANWPQDKNDTLSNLASIRAILENLSQKLPRNQKQDVEQLTKKLKRKRVRFFQYTAISNYSEEDLWHIFSDIQAVITTLEQLEKDRKWS